MSFTKSSLARVTAAVALSAAAATAGTAMLADAAPDSTVTGGAPLVAAVSAARAAVSAPAVTLDSAAGRVHLGSAAEMQAAGAQALSRISLPPNETLSVHWAAGADQGGDNAFGIEQTVEFNAACHWMRYYVSHGGDASVIPALQAIGSWPAIRQFAGGTAHYATIANAAAVGNAGPAQQELATNCPGI